MGSFPSTRLEKDVLTLKSSNLNSYLTSLPQIYQLIALNQSSQGQGNAHSGSASLSNAASKPNTLSRIASSSLNATLGLQSKHWICSMEPNEKEKHICFVVTDGGAVFSKNVPLDELREMKHALEKGEASIPWWQFFSAILHCFRKKKLSCHFISDSVVSGTKGGGSQQAANNTLCKLAMELNFPVVGRTIVTLNLRELPQQKIPNVIRNTYLIPLFDFYRLRVINKFVNNMEKEEQEENETQDAQKQLKLEREKNAALQQELSKLKRRQGMSHSDSLSSVHISDIRSARSTAHLNGSVSAGGAVIQEEQAFGTFPTENINRYIKDFRHRLLEKNIITPVQMEEFEKTVTILSRSGPLLHEPEDVEHAVDKEVLKWIKTKFSANNTNGRKTKRGSSEPDMLESNSGESPQGASLSNSSLTPQVQEAMEAMFDRIDQWNFDTFTLDKLSDGHPLYVTGYTLFVKHNLLNHFRIRESTLLNFLREIESGYHPNPYHNNLHACDVTQVLHVIMQKGNLSQYLAPEDTFAALFAAMVHDLDHPGLNNAFQVHSRSYLATLYNDRSVLENHHIAHAFELTRLAKYDVFASLNDSQRKDIRETVIGMVLSTDMGNHTKYVGKFKSRLEADADFTAKDDVRLALQIAIKTADVSNPSRPLNLYLQWTEKIMEEFFTQGDHERDLGFPISPLMDRKNAEIGRGQQAFMTFVIQPLFQSLTLLLPKMKFVEEYINENMQYWNRHSTLPDFRAQE